MKLSAAALAALALPLLAGCQPSMTLEEARAACTKQGGFLVVIYSQKITSSGVGKEIAKPGDCIPPRDLDIPARPAANAPPAP